MDAKSQAGSRKDGFGTKSIGESGDISMDAAGTSAGGIGYRRGQPGRCP